MGRMASLTLQKLQICVRTKAIFKLGNKGEGVGLMVTPNTPD